MGTKKKTATKKKPSAKKHGAAAAGERKRDAAAQAFLDRKAKAEKDHNAKIAKNQELIKKTRDRKATPQKKVEPARVYDSKHVSGSVLAIVKGRKGGPCRTGAMYTPKGGDKVIDVLVPGQGVKPVKLTDCELV